MKFFAEVDVRRLLHWKPLIDAMETALAEFSGTRGHANAQKAAEILGVPAPLLMSREY